MFPSSDGDGDDHGVGHSLGLSPACGAQRRLSVKHNGIADTEGSPSRPSFKRAARLHLYPTLSLSETQMLPPFPADESARAATLLRYVEPEIVSLPL